ncbi:MAG: FHA domain-containing protein [Propionibacteriaceae bacterium]|jgi:hypothetical protein|nr:FHA domain-containing protein [Propionibacteriaceae bacterium]
MDVRWVAEVWIDPDWYAEQGAEEHMPSPGLPEIIPLVKDANLIGRSSPARGLNPEIECDLDIGVSRSHAELTTDGTRWWVEDLGSANGTFVGTAAQPLPTMPIPAGKIEIGRNQAIYVGAWTKIVVRPATPDDAAAFGGAENGS